MRRNLSGVYKCVDFTCFFFIFSSLNAAKSRHKSSKFLLTRRFWLISLVKGAKKMLRFDNQMRKFFMHKPFKLEL